MANAFVLFGSLRVDSDDFTRALNRAERELKNTERSIDRTEKRAQSLGKTSAVSARQFEKMREAVAASREQMNQAAAAFARGEASSKQMASALNRVDKAASGVNSRLRDTSARLTDIASKSTSITAAMRNAGQQMSSFGQSLTVGLTLPLVGAGAAFIRSATSIDAMRNKLVAATGTVESANKKMAELRTLAQANAGVFTKGAVEMYAFLKPLRLSDGAITTMIKAMGRLKLANEDLDLQRMTMNMTQLFSQGFERADLKEAVGNFPRFGEILQTAFKLSGSDLDTIGKEMRDKLKQGLSKEQFFSAIADAIQNDSSLSKLTDTVGIRFQKLMERVFVAFEPMGNALLGILEPIAARLTPLIEQIGTAFSNLTPAAQGLAFVFVGIAAALGPALIIMGGLVSAIGAVAAAAPTLGIVAAVIVGLGVAMAPMAATAAAWYAAWQTNFGGIRDLVTTVGTAIQAAWASTMQSISELTEQLTAETAQFWAENGADIMQAVKTVSDDIRKIWTKVVAFWAENGDTIKEITSAAWSVVKTIIIGAVRIIANTIKLVAAVINGDWASAWDATKAILLGAMSAWLGILKGAGGALVGAIKIALQAVWALTGWLTKQGIDLGIAIVQGLAEGVKDSAGLVWNAMVGMATTAIEAAKEKLRSQSPSKVFFDIGRDVAQGFIDGIAAMRASVRGSMASLLDVTGIQGLAKKDATGVQLLTGLINDLARLNVVTKEQEVLLELTAGKYAKLNEEVRTRILLAAQELDRLNAVNEAQELMREILEAMGPGIEKSYQEVVAENLRNEAWKGLNETMRERLKLLARFADFAQRKPGEEILPQGRSQEGGIGTGGLGGLDADEIRETREELETPPRFKMWADFWTSMRVSMNEFVGRLPSIKQALGENLAGALMGIADVFANAVAQWDVAIGGFFKSVARGFVEMSRQIIAELIRIMIYKALLNLFGSLAGGLGGSTHHLESSSIGSAAGHTSPGGRAAGGLVSGRGTGTSDSILARLSNGEFVMPAKAVQHWGVGFMEQLRGLQAPAMAFAGGGLAGGGSVYNNQRSASYQVTVNMPSQGGSNGLTRDQVQRAVLDALHKAEQRRK